jgi:hypothetical protein
MSSVVVPNLVLFLVFAVMLHALIGAVVLVVLHLRRRT